MVETEALYNLLDTNDILLMIEEMHPSSQGVFNDKIGVPVIAINALIQDNNPLFRSVLAEEIGHHFTEIGHSEPRKNAKYSARLVRSRSEYRAHKWGANFLIPTPSLLKNIDSGLVMSRPDLCEWYQITPELLNVKFEVMAAEKPFWNLPSGKVLNLAKLPEVYVMRGMER